MSHYNNEKLSEIWRKASKELTQVKGQFGEASCKQACAMGAIVYYLSKGQNVFPGSLDEKAIEAYDRLLIQFKKVTGMEVVDLNDCGHKTFKELSRMARKAGL